MDPGTLQASVGPDAPSPIPWLAQPRRPSASGIDRALACRASCWLPDPRGPDSEHSRRGTRFHRALERYALGAKWVDVVTCVKPAEVEYLRGVIERFDAMNLTHWHPLPLAEVECWYNPLTEEPAWGTAGEFQPDGFWRGRADFICRKNNKLAVVDLKTGNPANLTRTRHSGQLAYFAVWAANMLPNDVRRLGGVTVAYFAPRTTIPLEGFLTLEDLEGWAKTFHDLEADLVVDTLTGRRPPIAEHKDRKWCPCRHYPLTEGVPGNERGHNGTIWQEGSSGGAAIAAGANAAGGHGGAWKRNSDDRPAGHECVLHDVRAGDESAPRAAGGEGIRRGGGVRGGAEGVETPGGQGSGRGGGEAQGSGQGSGEGGEIVPPFLGRVCWCGAGQAHMREKGCP